MAIALISVSCASSTVEANRFVITVGPRNTFAHIGTSRGTFELVATGGQLGWLMPTANMDQHVDYSQPDYYTQDESWSPEDDDAP